MSSPAGEVRVGIGARLRAGRERAGLTLLQAAEKLHVDSKVLEALEAEQFESLGAPVFARGHLRRYAELIGEQPVQLQAMYTETVRPAPPPDLTDVPKVRRPADSRKLVAPGFIGLAVIAIIGVVWIAIQVGRSMQQPQTEPAELAVAQPDEADAEAQALPPSAPLSAAPGRTRVATVAGASDTGTTGSSRPGAAAAPGAAGAPGAQAAGAAANAAATPPAPPPRPRTVDVKLKFAADSWVEVYDVNGERLFYDIGSADSERSVTGTPPLRVVLGNAAGVSLEVNGRARAVPPAFVQDDGAQFSINRSGRIVK